MYKCRKTLKSTISVYKICVAKWSFCNANNPVLCDFQTPDVADMVELHRLTPVVAI